MCKFTMRGLVKTCLRSGNCNFLDMLWEYIDKYGMFYIDDKNTVHTINMSYDDPDHIVESEGYEIINLGY